MLFFWSFPVIFFILSIAFWFLDALATHRAGAGNVSRTNWILALSVIAVISAILAVVIEGVAAVILFSTIGTFFSSI